MSRRDEKIQEALREEAAQFLSREAGPQSLITVTRVVLNDKGTTANIMLTVLPDEKEEEALNFANRNRREFSEFFEKRVRGVRTPHIVFLIDKGEKNRQRLDELT